MNECGISVGNMDHFLTSKQYAIEAEIEKGHIEENFKMPMIKRKNV